MGKFKKVKMKEGKVSLIVTKEGELQCDRRLKKKKKKHLTNKFSEPRNESK